jgi:arylsulfatase A-like enzyme
MSSHSLRHCSPTGELSLPLLHRINTSGFRLVFSLVVFCLGYGDLGCYGQEKIKTPNLDRLAAEGVRFTQVYAGSTVCAPSRCVLMMGLHTGHCKVRGNGGGGGPRSNVPLAPEDVCVAELLKKAGYATGLVGKWGLGEEGSVGVPTKKGFDCFFGYLNQHHAHNYYPDFLWRNEQKTPLPNVPSKTDNLAEKAVAYAPDAMLDEALKFLDANQGRSFFLEFATTLPHANNEKTRATSNGNEIPSDAPYANESWPAAEKSKAAMITRLDADVGKLLARLHELKLDERTLVIFSSDNGPHQEGGNKVEFFRSSGPLRGFKRSLTDGGIRVPAIARWTGTIKPGTVSDHVWMFCDFLPTACDLAGIETPKRIDGLSLLPTLTGRGMQAKHEFLYWEFHEGGFKQAVRHGDWKALRLAAGQPLELYNVAADPHEDKNVAADNPALVAKIEEYLKTTRTDSKEFPITAAKKKK